MNWNVFNYRDSSPSQINPEAGRKASNLNTKLHGLRLASKATRWRLSSGVVGPPLRIRHSTRSRWWRGWGLRGLHVSAACVPRNRWGVVHAGRAAGIGRNVGPRGDGDRGSGGKPASSRRAAGSGDCGVLPWWRLCRYWYWGWGGRVIWNNV